MPTLDTHRWTNCFADVETAGNGLRVRAFLQNVVEPALVSLDADVERWANTEEGGAPFAHGGERKKNGGPSSTGTGRPPSAVT